MKKTLFLFLSFLLMSIGVFSETITFKVYQSGSSSTRYIESETQQSSGSYNYKMCNWNPSNGQTRGNQSNVENNFYIYNTTAIPGNITKIQINVKSGTYTYSNKIYYVLSTSSCKSSSGGTTFSSNTANVTGSNTFFCIYFKNGATSGTSCLNSITITYTPTTSYTITAQSNNNTYGTVSLDNKVITATPNSGYRINDNHPYSVSPYGSATVVRGTGTNINKFMVTPSTNTTVTINFEPIPTYTVKFLNSDTIYEQRENIKQDSTITDFPTEIEPNEYCKKNGWEFIGWTENGTSTINSLEVTKNDTLYALYRILISGSVEYVTDTISNEFIGNDAGATTGTVSYKDFNDKKQTSNAIYSGNTAGGWLTNNNPPGPTIQIRFGDNASKRAGIVTSQSGGNLYKVKVIWNSKSENTTHSVWIYESDTVIDPLNAMFVGSHEHKTIPYSNSGGEVNLDGGEHIGIRSDAGTIYIDSLYITWIFGTLEYGYSTNPKCFETNISVAEWHKDYVEFDVGNYDSIHTYRGPMNSCDSIRITLVNKNEEECIRWFHVPVFAGVNTIIDNLDCDVVVLKDSTLTINSNISNNNVYVYPDGILHIKGNKTYTVNSLTLRRDNNDVPQFLYEGTLKVNDGMFFEMRTDAKDWRWLTLPDSIRVNEISDKSEVLLKYYDGKERAKNGRGGWKILNKDSISGFGTIFGIDIDTDEKRIYKFRLDTNILSQEKSVDNKKIKIREFSSTRPKNDHGWNLVGNPFMSMYNVSDNFGVKFEADSLVKEIINGQWTGRWITEEKDLRYIVVPSNKQEQHIIDAGGYEQICLQNGYKLPPFTSFFVQAKETADLIFYHGQRVANAPSRNIVTKDKESFLQINIGSIKTGCYISNKFNDSYEIGDDMESLYSTYQLINGYKLLYSAVNDSIIEHGIKVYTPAGNLYLDDKTNIEDFDEIYALYNGDWIDLLHGQTQDVSGEFILFAKRKTQVDIPTDISIIKDNNDIIKFMHNNNLYIKKNNHIYNILGGVVK